MIDTVTGAHASLLSGPVMTANLNINYRRYRNSSFLLTCNSSSCSDLLNDFHECILVASLIKVFTWWHSFVCSNDLSFVQSPIPLGSTVVLESNLDKKEGRKTLLSCKVTSGDGSKLHTESTGRLVLGAAPVWWWECVSLKPNLHCVFLFHTFPAALFVSISVCKILDGVWREKMWLVMTGAGCVTHLIHYYKICASFLKLTLLGFFKKKLLPLFSFTYTSNTF